MVFTLAINKLLLLSTCVSSTVINYGMYQFTYFICMTQECAVLSSWVCLIKLAFNISFKIHVLSDTGY